MIDFRDAILSSILLFISYPYIVYCSLHVYCTTVLVVLPACSSSICDLYSPRESWNATRTQRKTSNAYDHLLGAESMCG